MPGGARGRSGPPPDPNALRRDRPSDSASWIHLPVAGRPDPAPEWPLTRIGVRERELWEREWARPQAVMWERNHLEAEVALYVRTLAEAEKPKATVPLRTLVKQQMEFLGLSLPGLARNRWVIDGNPDEARTTQTAAGPSARERLKLVIGG